MKHRLKRALKLILRPVLYLFEDDHAPSHKAYRDSLMT